MRFVGCSVDPNYEWYYFRDISECIEYGQPYGFHAENGVLPTLNSKFADFIGWFTLPENGEQIYDWTVVNTYSDVTLYAHWRPKKYVLKLDANGGECPVSSYEATYCEFMSGLPVPTRENYNFLGWVLTKEPQLTANRQGNRFALSLIGGTHQFDENSRFVWYDEFDHQDQLTLYACWDAKTSWVSFDPNGGESDSYYSKFRMAVKYGQKYVTDDVIFTSDRFARDPYCVGKTFIGWFTQKEGGQQVMPDTIVTATSDHTLYAHWDETSYNIRLDANGGECSMSSITLRYTQSLEALPIPTRTHYAFMGWSTSPDCKDYYITSGSELLYSSIKDFKERVGSYGPMLTLYARWYYSGTFMTFHPCGGTVDPPYIYAAYGERFGTLPVPVRSGYEFAGWFTAEQGGEQITGDKVVDTLDDQIIVYAHWIRIVQQTPSTPTDSSTEKKISQVVTEADGTQTTYTLLIRLPQSKVGTNTSMQISGTVLPRMTDKGITDQTIQWQSSNTSIATVDRYSGVVRGVSPGKVTITATSNRYNITGSVELTVYGALNFYSLRYSFSNSYDAFGYPRGFLWSKTYKIPYWNYAAMFGDNDYSRKLFENQGKWGGNCHGMVTTSALYYRSDITRIHVSSIVGRSNAKVSDISRSLPNWAMALDFIEQMQIAQDDHTYLASRNSTTNDLNGLVSAVKSSIAVRYPMRISIQGSEGGHALLPYDIRDTSILGIECTLIYVYDCNYPNDNNRYIAIVKNSSGNYISWQYQLFDSPQVIYGTGREKAAIRYNNFGSINNLWSRRGHLIPSSTSSSAALSTALNEDAAVALYLKTDVDVIDSEGFVTSVEDGRVVSSEIENAVYNEKSGLYIEDGEVITDDNGVLLYLPADTYEVVGTDEDNVSFDVLYLHNSVSIEAGMQSTVTVNALGENADDLIKIEDKCTADKHDGNTLVFAFDDEANAGIDKLSVATSGLEGVSTFGITDEGIVASGLSEISITGECDANLAQTDSLLTYNGDVSDVLIAGNFIDDVDDVLVYEDVNGDGSYETLLGVENGKVVTTALKLNTNELTMHKGDINALTASLLPAEHTDAPEIIWVSSDEKVATVNEDGTVTAVGGGYANITASCDDLIFDSCMVEVVETVSNLECVCDTINMLLNEVVSMEVTLTPADSTSIVEYTSSDESVVTVSGTGEIMAVGIGEATVSASTEGFSDSCVVTVTAPLEAVLIDKQQLFLETGEKAYLSAITLPQGAESNIDVFWMSSDESCATVSDNGEVTAVSDGECVITANIAGIQCVCDVVVCDRSKILGIEISSTFNGISLTWNNIPAAYYDILRSEDGENFNVIASVSAEDGTGYIDDSLAYNKDYFYKVAAFTEDGSLITESTVVDAVTNLVTPTLTAASSSYNSVKLTWSKVAGANGYEIYRSVGEDEPVLIKKITKGTTVSFTNGGLQCGTEYTYYVRAYKTVSKVNTFSDPSDTKTAKPVPATPGKPAAAPNTKNNTIKVTWKAVAGANSYEISRSEQLDGEYSVIGEVSAVKSPSFVDSNVEVGRKYFYRVKAFRKLADDSRVYGTDSVPSASASLSLLAPAVRLVSSSYNSAKIGWDKVTGATGYEVWRSTDGTEFVKIATINKASTLTYSNTKLTAGTYYSYKVLAFTVKNKVRIAESGLSDIVEVTPAIAAPKTFKVAASGYSLKASWSAVAGASGYELYRSVNGKDYELIATTTAKVKTYTDSNVNRGIQYSYKVRAIGKTAEGAFSAVRTATPTLAAPGKFKAKATNYNTITLTWAKSSGATGYAVYRSTTKNGTYYRIGSTEGNTAVKYVDTDRDTGVTYYYVIKAMRKQGGTTGYSKCSAIKSAKTSLGKPGKPTSKKIGAGIAQLGWKAVTGADGYEIFRYNSSTKKYEHIGETNNPEELTYTDEGLTAKKTYQYKIRAYRVNSDGQRAYSAFTAVLKRTV